MGVLLSKLFFSSPCHSLFREGMPHFILCFSVGSCKSDIKYPYERGKKLVFSTSSVSMLFYSISERRMHQSSLTCLDADMVD